MTWNLLGSRGVLVEPVAAAILERRPDAVAIQEIQRRQARRLARRLGWHHKWALKHFPRSHLIWWRAEGLAILSPHALRGAIHLRISDERSRLSYRRRVLTGATVRREDAELRLFNTHLGGSTAERLPQVRRIAARLRSAAPAGTSSVADVLAGDFNAAGDPATLDPLTALGLRDPGGGHSSPADDPYQRIDYVLVPQAATSVSSDTPAGGAEWARLSDHLPVVVAFTVSNVQVAP